MNRTVYPEHILQTDLTDMPVEFQCYNGVSLHEILKPGEYLHNVNLNYLEANQYFE